MLHLLPSLSVPGAVDPQAKAAHAIEVLPHALRQRVIQNARPLGHSLASVKALCLSAAVWGLIAPGNEWLRNDCFSVRATLKISAVVKMASRSPFRYVAQECADALSVTTK